MLKIKFNYHKFKKNVPRYAVIVAACLIFFGMLQEKVFFMQTTFLQDNLPNIAASNLKSYPCKIHFDKQKDKGLWLVNSKSRARKMQNKYNLFETDVHFNEELKCLALTKKVRRKEVCYDEFLGSLNKPNERFHWLDIQLIDEKNFKLAHQYIETIAAKFNIKQRMILENRNAKFLTPLTQKGFYTAFYIPWFETEKMSVTEIKNQINYIENNLKRNQVCAISAFANRLMFVKKYFPKFDFVSWWWLPWYARIFDEVYILNKIKSYPQLTVFLEKNGRDVK
jgi:hypothetical protein